MPSLVQVGQQAKLALENVSYSLSEEAKATAQDQLSKDVIDALNKKAESIAVAMKVAPDALRIEKLNFNSFDFAPEGAVFAARAMGATLRLRLWRHLFLKLEHPTSRCRCQLS